MTNKSAAAKVQFIQTPGGDDLAVMSRKDYDRLVSLATDVADARIVKQSINAIEQGREVVLQKTVVDRLHAGDNPVRVVREWREMIQRELAVSIGISQSYLSEIESGKRKGPAELQKKLARTLGVPVDLLID